jgi:polysaccharide export outer membrane protein
MAKRLLVLWPVLSAVMCAYAAGQTLQQRPRYTLHPGDTVELALRFTPEYNQTLTVQPDGYITVNLIGDVQVSGLTLDQAHDAIVQKLSRPLNKPELSLVLKDFQHPYVVVGGEVQQPGKIELRQDMTAMQAVILAGGFKPTARDTRIVVFRHIDSNMGEVKVLNLHKIQDSKELERDMALQAGDMILVPQNRVATFSRYMDATHFSSYMSPQAGFP